MQTVALKSQARKEDGAAKDLRSDGQVPCVIYGNDTENRRVVCDYSELYRAYAKAGNSVIVDLDIDGTVVPCVFHEVQFHPVKDSIIHVDFYAVDMKKEIDASIPLNFTGEAKAVDELGGVLVTVMDHLNVRCLPTKLPASLDADLSKLETFADSIVVTDVSLPEGVTCTDEPDAMIATVQEPRKDEPEPEATEGEGGDQETKEGEKDAAEDKKEEGAEQEQKSE